MKVVHVEAGKHLYGGALQVFYLLRGLREHGVGNVLVCPQGSDIGRAARELGIPVREISMQGDLDLMLGWRLARVVRQEQADILHLHSRRGADIWGALASKLTGVKTVLTRRVDNAEPVWFAKRKYRWFDRVVTISHGIYRVLQSQQVDEGRMQCIHSVVDLEKYQPTPTKDRIKQVFDLPAEALTVGVIAQLIERKGHKYLIDVMARILAEVPAARFIFFGKGPIRATLEQYCREKGVGHAVTFAGFRTDMDSLLPCLDLVVHPALMEGLGVSLLQASACQVPIVAARAGGIPEAVEEGVNGYLVPPGQSEPIYEKVVTVLSDSTLRATLGQGGRDKMQREFSIDAMTQSYIKLYRELLAAGQ